MDEELVDLVFDISERMNEAVEQGHDPEAVREAVLSQVRGWRSNQTQEG